MDLPLENENLPSSSAMGSLLAEMRETSQISSFFKDRCIFLTGATGFVGKVFLEKLLRSCQQVRTVYVLMREKEGQEPRHRLDDLFASKLFDQLKRKNATILTKVVPIIGDISFPGLGISQSNTTMLCKHVSVVVHSAATVRFDETLKKSVNINVVGTQRVIELCQNMTKLSALLHISTAYSNCNREEIEEIIYKEKVAPENVVAMTQWMDEELIECILPKLMDGRPTTYHYTKALAENLLMAEECNLPIAIVRPSIVTAAFKEPVKGWVDGVNGPSNFIIHTGKGLLRTMLVYKNTAVDWMPVDLLANLMLTAIWNIGTNRPTTVKVYNCTSGNLNRVTWSDVERTAYPLLTRHPSMRVLRYPGGSFKSSKLLNAISIKLEHSLPAHLIDMLAGIFGYKTEFTTMVTRMERAAGYLEYFTTKQWTFQCKNFLELMEQQSTVDKEIFNFDLRPIEWLPYLESYILGIRKFILKEEESTLPAARRRLAWLYYGGLAGQCSFIFGCVYLLLTHTNFSNHLMWTSIGLGLQLSKYMSKSRLKKIY